MRSYLRFAGVYAALATLTTSLFIVLHDMGNRLPFELAVKRLADEFRATPWADWGMRGGLVHDSFHYCELAGGVVADARAARNGDGTALRRAIAPQTVPGPEHSPGVCDDVKAAVLDKVWLEGPVFANLRHWLGGKALYAIALRYWTVRDIYLAINALVHCGFLFLALVLLQIGWRALLVGTPILAFGLFFAGVERYFNVTDGLPFAWALFAPALVALLLRLGLRMSGARALFFFRRHVVALLVVFRWRQFPRRDAHRPSRLVGARARLAAAPRLLRCDLHGRLRDWFRRFPCVSHRHRKHHH